MFLIVLMVFCVVKLVLILVVSFLGDVRVFMRCFMW